MPNNTPQVNTRQLDTAYLKFFKYAVLTLMTLALLAAVVMLPMAGYQFFQTPAPPTPAKAPPERAVNLDDLKKFLLDEEKRRLEQEKNGTTPANKPASTAPSVTQLYAEQALALYRCAEDFRALAEQPVDNATDTELSDRRERQRASIESLASNPFRGPSWPDAMVAFTCSVLKNTEFARLKREKLIGSVVNPTIRFHANAWASIEQAKAEFRQQEAARVKGEIAAEDARVFAAKARAVMLLSAVGGAILFFLVMALYLIFARIEINLGWIHGALVGGRQINSLNN